MQPMWLCLFSGRQLQETFECAQWRKVNQMQPMWLCLFSGRPFEATFECAQWGKVEQMQPMWLWLFSGRQFQETCENAQWRKVKQLQPVLLCLFSVGCCDNEVKSESANWRPPALFRGQKQGIQKKSQVSSFKFTPWTLQKTAFLAHFGPKICFFYATSI